MVTLSPTVLAVGKRIALPASQGPARYMLLLDLAGTGDYNCSGLAMQFYETSTRAC